MPNMADVTIKKADGTTDLVFKARQPSSGDRNPARWSPDSDGARGERPTFEVVASKTNGANPKRKVTTSLIVPVIRTVGETSTVTDVFRAQTTFSFPLSATDGEIDEAVAQAVNLINSSLVKSAMAEGYAPT